MSIRREPLVHARFTRYANAENSRDRHRPDATPALSNIVRQSGTNTDLKGKPLAEGVDDLSGHADLPRFF